MYYANIFPDACLLSSKIFVHQECEFYVCIKIRSKIIFTYTYFYTERISITVKHTSNCTSRNSFACVLLGI